MHDPIDLYRFALRSGNRSLSTALARAMRADPALRERADRELQELPRGRVRWSRAGARALDAVLRRLGSVLL